MIVKNEAHVLPRCLASVRPFIDSWVIVDTGSSDGTQELICDVFHDLPGNLVERPWKNFGHNRSESLAYARGSADFLLTLDADEFLQTAEGFRWPQFVHDAYDFTVQSGGVTYKRIQMVRSTLPWRYEGVLHEYITCDQPFAQALLPGVETVRLLEGARSRDPLTYHRDALLLEEAMTIDPTNARNMFYLAQSYRDAREPELALARYLQRAAMVGFAEETWSALYEAAKLMEYLDMDWPATRERYLEAYRHRPWRAEPLYRIGLHLQKLREYAEAHAYLKQAMQIPLPDKDVLFVEADAYRIFVPIEYAVSCYWLGLHHEAIAVTTHMLQSGILNEDQAVHVTRNREFSLTALREMSSS